MTRIACLVAAALLAATTGIARAEEPQKDNYDGLASGFVVFTSLELAPAVLLVTDLIARPQSKGYAITEIAIGSSAAVLNTWIGIDFARTPNCSDCSDVTPYFLAIAAFDLAIVAHGTYLLLRDEPQREVALIPTVVSAGTTMAPGLGLSGTF